MTRAAMAPRPSHERWSLRFARPDSFVRVLTRAPMRSRLSRKRHLLRPRGSRFVAFSLSDAYWVPDRRSAGCQRAVHRSSPLAAASDTA